MYTCVFDHTLSFNAEDRTPAKTQAQNKCMMQKAPSDAGPTLWIAA